jgi:glycine/D-amino acid oxidase-like deaminating enzyme
MNGFLQNENGKVSSGRHLSCWYNQETEGLRYKPLENNIETEIVIIGGGVAGISIAYCLTLAGRSVALVEDGYLGSGETGRSTAQACNRGLANCTETHASKISEAGIVSASGFQITAKHVVIATNSPVNNKYDMHLKQGAYRTYVIAGLVKKTPFPKRSGGIPVIAPLTQNPTLLLCTTASLRCRI